MRSQRGQWSPQHKATLIVEGGNQFHIGMERHSLKGVVTLDTRPPGRLELAPQK